MLLAALLLPAPAMGGSSVTFEEGASFEGCHELNTGVRVPVTTAENYVPPDYTVQPDPADPTGQTTPLLIAALRCEQVSVDGSKLGRVSMAFAFFGLEGAPKRSEESPSAGDNYLLFFSADSKPFADWLRAGTGLEAYYVRDMIYDYPIAGSYDGPPTTAPFSFKAPGPLDWGFRVDSASAPEHREEEAKIHIGELWFWQDTKTANGNTWRVRIATSSHDDYLALANVTIEAAPGSEIEKIIGPGEKQDPFAGSLLMGDDWTATKTRTLIASE